MRILIFQRKIEVSRSGRRTLYLNLPCTLHLHLQFGFLFTCGLSDLQLSRAPSITSEVCCCLPPHCRSPLVSAALGCRLWLWLSPFQKSITLDFGWFSPLLILSCSPGTAQTRVPTWPCHFCLKETQHVKKVQTYQRDYFLQKLFKKSLQCWAVCSSILWFGCWPGLQSPKLGAMLYTAAPSLKIPKAHMKTEEGTSADRRHQLPY